MDKFPPSKVLLVWVEGTGAFQLDAGMFTRRFQAYGNVQKVLIFDVFYGRVKVLVEMESLAEAIRALQNLNKCNLFGPCCRMNIHFSEHQSIRFKHDNCYASSSSSYIALSDAASTKMIASSSSRLQQSKSVTADDADWNDQTSDGGKSCYSEAFHRMLDEYDSTSPVHDHYQTIGGFNMSSTYIR